LAVVAIVGALLVTAVVDLPAFGSADAPAHTHVAPRYLAESDAKLHIPNVVTTVLASYRGFDTLGETIVIFAAGLGVLLLLAGKTKTRLPDYSKPKTARSATRPKESSSPKKMRQSSAKKKKAAKKGSSS
jgi:hypothetical protein